MKLLQIFQITTIITIIIIIKTIFQNLKFSQMELFDVIKPFLILEEKTIIYVKNEVIY